MSNRPEIAKFHEMIGAVVVSFQALERATEQMIFASLTCTYSQVRILVSEMSFRSKVNVMNSLIKDLHGPEEELREKGNIHSALGSIVRRCRECEERRNQLMHSFWTPGFKNAPDLVLRTKDHAKSKKGYTYTAESYDGEVLQKDIDKIESTTRELSDFCMEISVQFRRIHGVHGLASSVDHSMLVEAINQSVVDKGKGKIDAAEP